MKILKKYIDVRIKCLAFYFGQNGPGCHSPNLIKVRFLSVPTKMFLFLWIPPINSNDKMVEREMYGIS